MNQKFLIGERVTRRIDGVEGVVTRAEFYEGDHLYYVRLDRDGEVWAGSTEAWDHATHLHAHVEYESSDCDGRYSGGRIDHMISTERCDQFGDLRFKERVAGDVISLHSEGTLHVTPEGLEWDEPTEEGYRHTTVTWCEDEGCTDKTWQRDHRAEAAGY